MQPISFLILDAQHCERQRIVALLQPLEPGPVHQASTGQEALEGLHRCGGVDIAICNLRAAGRDGLTFLREVSKTHLARAILTTGQMDASLCSAAQAMITCLDMQVLGDLGQTSDVEQIKIALDAFRAGSDKPVTPELNAPPSIADIQRAFDDDEFEPYYQPKIMLNGGELKGAEVLARWNHPRLGILSPGYFLPTLEAHHLIDKLLVRLLEKGLMLQKTMSLFLPPVELAFNVHATQLGSTTFVDQVEKALSELRLPAHGLLFEITETGLVNSTANSLENLIRLRLMGCGLAMDDFGSGYSSLQRLCDLPFSQLKLDGSFVRELESRPDHRAVIESAVRLADSLGLSLVVEGVETSEQQEQLRRMGCSIGQGYGLARPMSGTHFFQYCLDAKRSKRD
ncbi:MULTISPECIES: EAL domain-containing protein [Pseudomonas]|uniref:EAL domain-containing response regulator n=1 Tax=Pseudomonas TaxID=286 RepID=UPI0005A70CAE|nr:MULTISPECIES: EAL domain-containing response regulator [Pseudomonas]AZD67448.1 diguanylate cyclase/phosphodiesterase [Pseudomonas chlororaphis subsp. aurantiaca]AZD93720.1 diguanylate cyclase/phosphodiesterase [Pseudomonas chlororaphis subsp. aureofaciens]AZE00027.1 diguanylate cyclase/phosphodiesterase [Pseudomonas chlororaphis subsp. aureofaciens]KAB0533944.1 EAL domain-containing protein [Pseudomonas chlororaphis subsp. aureofaciens]PWY51327.1 EAL domain-containing protein [Pseudomonas s